MSGQQEGSGDAPRRAGAFAVMRAVFGAFVGIRRGRDLNSDALSISLGQAVVAGIIGAVLFVLFLVLVVSWVTS